MIDDLLVGKFLPPDAGPNCGHIIASDFKDENNIVEDAPRRQAGLALLLKAEHGFMHTDGTASPTHTNIWFCQHVSPDDRASFFAFHRSLT